MQHPCLGITKKEEKRKKVWSYEIRGYSLFGNTLVSELRLQVDETDHDFVARAVARYARLPRNLECGCQKSCGDLQSKWWQRCVQYRSPRNLFSCISCVFFPSPEDIASGFSRFGAKKSKKKFMFGTSRFIFNRTERTGEMAGARINQFQMHH